MTHIPLPNIDVHRKLNAKRLLTFGIIVMLMLTSFAVMVSRPARAAEPWWFLPHKWNVETAIGSYRYMLIAAHPTDTEIPPWDNITTTGMVSFTLDISEPDEDGNATINVTDIFNERFYIKTIKYSIFTFYLWGYIYATGDGSGTLATKDNIIDVDVFQNVTGDDGTFTIDRKIGDGVPDPAGSSLVYLPLNMNVYSTGGEDDPDPDGRIDMTMIFDQYVTTGFTKTTIYDETPWPDDQSHPPLHGMSVNATGVPADPYTGIYTGVISGGLLDTYAFIIIRDSWSDSLFAEVMVSETVPPIPSLFINDVASSPKNVSQGQTVSINVTLKNELDDSTTSDITVYANETEIETQTDVTLAAGANTTLTFTWDTSGKSPGKYIITAELYGEVDGTVFTFHNSYPTHPGDGDGDFDVDIIDFVAFAGAYGTSPPSNPACDLDCDGDVDIIDFVVFSGKYGKNTIVVVT